MKKIVLLIILFYTFLNATELKQVYYKDYQFINRMVFVFSDQCVVSLSQQNNILTIEIPEATKNIAVKPFRAKKNEVLDHVNYYENGKLSIYVHTDSIPSFKYFRYWDEENYKLVVDLYNIIEPVTKEECEAFLRFYKVVGYSSKALQVQRKLLQIAKRESLDVIAKKETTLVVQEEITLPERVSNSDLPITVTEISQTSISNYYYVAVLVVLLILLIIIIFRMNKKYDKPISPKGLICGLGNENLEREIALELYKNQWKTPEISREINVSEKKIKEWIKESI